jgi:hypothetical protein
LRSKGTSVDLDTRKEIKESYIFERRNREERDGAGTGRGRKAEFLACPGHRKLGNSWSF